MLPCIKPGPQFKSNVSMLTCNIIAQRRIRLSSVFWSACSAQGLQSTLEHARGWDHGVFIPLLAMLHDTQTPVLQLSLLSSLDPAAHLALGRALSPLRDRGVLVLGSGLSYHNMRGFNMPSASRSGASDSRESSHAFRRWLSDTVCNAASRRCATMQARTHAG